MLATARYCFARTLLCDVQTLLHYLQTQLITSVSELGNISTGKLSLKITFCDRCVAIK